LGALHLSEETNKLTLAEAMGGKGVRKKASGTAQQGGEKESADRRVKAVDSQYQKQKIWGAGGGGGWLEGGGDADNSYGRLN